MEINKTNIMDFIKKCNLKPEKDFGQNFLIEPAISENIVKALNVDNENVLEIGPGLGSLTNYLCKTQAKITCVDVDSRMINFLRVIYENENLSLVIEDARNIEYGHYDKIISNLPYNITTELLHIILTKAVNCKKFVFMCQKENFAHINDVSGKEYGPISVLCHLIGRVKKEMVVKAGSFYPAPQCDSVVFSIESFKTGQICRENELEAYYFAKQMFLNRRKTLSNNLMNYVHNKDIVNSVFSTFELKDTIRPEEISPEIFLEISNFLRGKKHEN